MTPAEILTYARAQYNAVNDDFFTDEELYRHIQAAEDILARECLAIENTYSTTTVSSQREYTYPTQAIAIKRITYNGRPLQKIKFREDDWLTGGNETTTSTGTPIAYAIYDKTIYLRPVPNAAYTLKLYTYDTPQEVTSGGTLDIPAEFHLGLANFLLMNMALKDQNFQAAAEWERRWEAERQRCMAWSRKRQVADGFNTVRDEAEDWPFDRRFYF